MRQNQLIKSVGEFVRDCLGVALAGVMLAVASAAMAQTQATGVAPGPADISQPKVTGMSGRLELGREITLQVDHLSAWAVNNDPQKLVLFLNGRALKGLYPEQVNLAANKLLFHLRRTPEARVVWNDLFHEPVPSRPVSLSVGLVEKGAFDTVLDYEHPATLTVVPTRVTIIAVASFVAALALFFYLARTTNIMRLAAGGDVSNQPRPFSLGRVQLAFWFFIIFASYVYLWLITGDFDTIGPSHLALAGISGVTAFGAEVVDRRDAGADALSQMTSSQGFFADLLTGTSGYRFHCFQICAWTVLLGLIFIITVYQDLVMPPFGPTLVGLSGMSAATYLGFALIESGPIPELETTRR